MLFINNIKFAENKEKLSGELDVAILQRLQEFLEASGTVQYALTGFVNKDKLPVLNLKIYGKISTLCQSCFECMDIDVSLVIEVVVVNSEEDADALMFGSDDAVDYAVVKDDKYDILSLIEDELITSFPLVIRHTTCQEVEYKDEISNPFNVLKNNFNKE